MQLVHHIINYRLTLISEAENLIVPGQDGGRAGRGVDLNQLKLDEKKTNNDGARGKCARRKR
jgi:hypothetical protein